MTTYLQHLVWILANKELTTEEVRYLQNEFFTTYRNMPYMDKLAVTRKARALANLA